MFLLWHFLLAWLTLNTFIEELDRMCDIYISALVLSISKSKGPEKVHIQPPSLDVHPSLAFPGYAIDMLMNRHLPLYNDSSLTENLIHLFNQY